MNIEFYKHNIGAEEKNKVLECLDGLFLTTGSYVAEFEDQFAQYLGVKHVVGLTSCTAALHLSLLALGIGRGDEVITTPMTFIATATAIMHTGAKPVFVDVEPQTGLIDPERIADAVTTNTKAVIPVHLYGQMCDMKRIRQIADDHDLKVVEDAAHCVEGKRDGIGPGQLGDIACFSFYATKNITSGEGGAVATNDKDLAERVRLLRTHGMSKEAADRYTGRYQHWDMIACGWKYNMDNIQAALLLPQLTRIDAVWQKRSLLYSEYVERLQRVRQVTFPALVPNSRHACHLFTIWVPPGRRDEILSRLGDDGVGVAVNYRAIHLLTYFKETYGFVRGQFPVAEEIGERTISLPFHVQLRPGDIETVSAKLHACVEAC